MIYNKHNFEPGQVLKAQDLNEMEDGIVSATGALNLLDNSYFERMSEIVNQRGFVSGNSVSSWEYFIDRWINTSDSARVFTLTDNGMVLEADTTLCQKLEGVKSGTVLTFAACMSDGTIATATGTVTYNSDNSWLRLASRSFDGFELYIDTYAGLLQAIVYTRSNAELKWAALYEGEYTAENIPTYMPKGYATELFACQRYYENSWFKVGKTQLLQILGTAWSNQRYDCPIYFKQTKRTWPTMTYYPSANRTTIQGYINGVYRDVTVDSSEKRFGLSGMYARVKTEQTDLSVGYTYQFHAHWEASADL